MNSVDDILSHHGIKGQKWGIRNKKELTGRKSGSKNVASEEEDRSEQLKRKYGPDSMKDGPPVPVKDRPGFKGFTPAQKKLALELGGVALIAGASYYLNRESPSNPYVKNMAEEATKFIQEVNSGVTQDLSKTPFFNPGLAAHWEKGVELPVGSVLQRMSTVKETEIRPKGFFAAFDNADVERYKAELPTWWKKWGYPEKEGYLTQIHAKSAIKAPSGKETFEMLKSLYDDDNVIGRVAGQHVVLQLKPETRAKVVESLAQKGFNSFVVNWANGYDDDPYVQKMFSMAKARGYNALIDFNDSGHLAKTPLRLLNGSDFEIKGHTKVSKAQIEAAQKALKELVMSAIASIDDFLSHHGVKGQKWGIRNKRTNKENKIRNHRQKISDRRHQLSDSDLKSFIERLNQEKKLKTLVNEDLNPGKTIAKRILSESGQKVAKTVIAGAALYGVKAAIEKKFDAKEAANYITPKPKNK